MKRILILVVVLMVTPVYAVPGWLIGFTIGVGVQVVPWTRNHIIMPPLKAIKHQTQKLVRPIPQDKVDAQRKKEEKERRKHDRNR